MDKGRITLIASLLLSGALLAGCGDDGGPNNVESSFDNETTNEREPGTSEVE